MKISRIEIEELIKKNETLPKWKGKNLDSLAICHVLIGEYSEAKKLFKDACLAMYEPPKKQLDITHINRLVDACTLSGNTDLYSSTMDWLITYRIIGHPDKQPAPMACYSYSIMELLSKSGRDIAPYIEIILKYPRFKDVYATGIVFQALINKDQEGFENSLVQLLRVHEMQAKHGGLRYAGIDFRVLCMFAMSIGRVASTLGFQVNIENEYFSKGYLEFLNRDVS